MRASEATEATMIETEVGPISADVIDAQVREFRGDLWLPLVLLVPMFAFSVWSMNLSASVLLGLAGAAWTALATHRSRDPSKYLRGYTDPISVSVLRSGGLEPREAEDALGFRIRVVDTMDALGSHPLTMAAVGRRIALATTLVVGLTGVGLLASLPSNVVAVSALSGGGLGIVLSEMPRRWRAAKARAVLKEQLSRLDP